MFGQKLCKGISLAKTQDNNPKLDGVNISRYAAISRYSAMPFTDQGSLVSPTRINLCTRPPRRIHRGKLHVKSQENDCHQRSESRSFMKLNLTSPSPTSYNPASDPPNMTTPPAFTMRPKTYPEKDGGDRVAWGKEWFSNCDRWSMRVNFDSENKWPSPTDHVPKSTIGWPQVTLHQSPSHSFSKREEFSLVGKDARTSPGPCSYDRSRSQNAILANSPSFSIQDGRRNGTFPIITRGQAQGPGSYNPNIYKTSQKVRRPAFTISKSPRIIGITRNCTF